MGTLFSPITILFIIFFLSSPWLASPLPNNNNNIHRQAHDVGASDTFDCVAREFVWQYSQQIQPWRSNLGDVFDALQLTTLCNVTSLPKQIEPAPKPKVKLAVRGGSMYVDATSGDDSNSGSFTSPFKTIQKAVDVAVSDTTIYLRQGTYYLDATINLGPENNDLTFTSYNNEQVEINGGIPLTTKWAPYNTSGSNNIYVTDLSGQNIQEMMGLQLNGQRCIRARFPNANPEIDLFPVGYITSASWIPPHAYPVAETYTLSSPIRPTGVAFQQFTIGSGGSCSVFDPPESFWCSSDIAGGGASIYQVPGGLVFNDTTFSGRVWANPIGGIVHVFHPGHWENWMFEIDYYNATNYTIGWHYGGFQGARGATTGGEWFVENIFEELDYPSEFFYDAPNQMLYYFNNATGAPPSDNQSFVATNLKVLFNITGSQQSPVSGITFHNITFQNAAYTYMDAHGVPSGGDWSLQRSGALFVEGSEGLTVSQCLFIRLDGNALFLSGYNRNATIEQNEFVWIGDSAMAAWGYTTDNYVNGTEGNFPRYTQVLYNFVHEHGQYTKQTSAWMQAKTVQTYFEGNIFFNGPRAGININDGFGGGNELFQNVLFNQVRETYDHGPFNSWDREPFWTNIENENGSFTQLYNEIHHNVFLCNYYAQACIDNDDGSTYFLNHNNFEIYGCHKDYFAGHNKFTYDSVLAYPVCWGRGCAFFTDFVPGYVDGVYNISCIMGSNTPYLYFQSESWNMTNFNKAQVPYSANNNIFSNYNITIYLNGIIYPASEWQATGQDQGTKFFSAIPEPEDIITMAKQVLVSGL